jgi:hypothetical protein
LLEYRDCLPAQRNPMYRAGGRTVKVDSDTACQLV